MVTRISLRCHSHRSPSVISRPRWRSGARTGSLGGTRRNTSVTNATTCVTRSSRNGAHRVIPNSTPPTAVPAIWPIDERALFVAIAVASCASGTSEGRIASSAGSNSARHAPSTAATATRWTTVAPSSTSATTRLASATTCAASQASITRLRSHRSTSAPPGSASTACAVASAASTSPEAAADPVIASTTRGDSSRTGANRRSLPG